MAGRKNLTTVANLANLLPTGTILAFEALIPSFSQNGKCVFANKFLTLSVIVVCSIVCFLSSFTDSFVHDGKVYYGIATSNGLYIFNDSEDDNFHPKEHLEKLKTYHITPIDFVHAFTSLIVFLVFSISSSDVQSCFLAEMSANEEQLIINLPLGAGLLSSFLFMLFPTKRRGIGYADTASNKKPETVDTASNQTPETKTTIKANSTNTTRSDLLSA